MIGSANKTDNNILYYKKEKKKKDANYRNWQLLFYFILRKGIIKFCGCHQRAVWGI